MIIGAYSKITGYLKVNNCCSVGHGTSSSEENNFLERNAVHDININTKSAKSEKS